MHLQRNLRGSGTSIRSDGVGDDGVGGEEEEMVISSRGIQFHGAEAGCHALEGVVGKELEF